MDPNNPARTGTANVWLDLVSPSHPLLFQSVVRGVTNATFTTTVRQKTETVDLAAIKGFDFEVLGRDFDNTLLRKMGIPLRTVQLATTVPEGDVSLSARNAMCVLASRVRGIPSIHFTDNDITAYVRGRHFESLYNFFESLATHIVVPEAFETDVFLKWGASPEQIHTFDGYKEDIYVADFEPNSTFLAQLPFDEYIVVRPEALDAAYVDAEESLVPALLDRAQRLDMNVVYLPRGRNDETYADSYSSTQVYTPSKALDGLQLEWYSQGVLTGSGTMAREAACMGKPAVSFFPAELISVDRQQIRENMLLNSRDVDEIFEYLQSFSKTDREPDLARSNRVQRSVIQLVQELIADATEGPPIRRRSPLDQLK